MYEDDYVLVCSHDRHDGSNGSSHESSPNYLADVSEFIEHISNELWTINRKIHDNPELGYEEHKAHALLTSFLRSRKGWKITPSAYGMDTAWVAVYDSGEEGPVVSLNVEMGVPISPRSCTSTCPCIS